MTLPDPAANGAAAAAPDGAGGGVEREAQHAYWEEHSKDATVEAMMLDSQAADIDKLERPEVLRVLGPVDGARVVELGAGIGRFTGELARGARSVLALDFMQHLIDENAAAHGALPNVELHCGDATELDLPPASADVVFSNWLLMYLSDAEVFALAEKMLTWLVDGGVVFFRESCFRQSGDRARASNPTHYRNPREYFRIFDAARAARPGGAVAHFELVVCKCVDTYVRVKRNQNQVCWKWRVAAAPAAALPRALADAAGARHFLDGGQYSEAKVARYQRMFGAGFASPGGAAAAADLTARLELRPDDAVLDVGCGPGGAAVLMARTYGAYVVALDLSVNMVLAALEGCALSGTGADAGPVSVSFEVSDAARRELPAAHFDAVYAKDSLLHVADKPALFARLLALLKPGGRLLVTDYCAGAGAPSEGMAEYVAARAYDIHTVAAYGEMVAAAGFAGVRAEDRSAELEAALKRELAAAEAGRAEFVAALGEAEYAAATASWREKLERVRAGEQRWGLFTARAP
jgi:phosphoethanolamine N-methyltransferase